MSDYYIIKKSTLEDIANSIRSKSNVSNLIKVSDLDTSIDSITTGETLLEYLYTPSINVGDDANILVFVEVSDS